MKRILTIAAALLLGAVLCAQEYAVDPVVAAALRENPMRSANNHFPYVHGDLHETPPPAGYKPFYISHYGRHGSRHSWGGENYELVIGILHTADSLGVLNDAGRAALAQTRQVQACWDGMDGRLSPRGVREHAAIARRLVKRYPSVFKGSPDIRAVSSTVQRSIISMVSFTNAVTALNPRTQWSFDTGETFMKYISDTGERVPAYKKHVKHLRKHLFDSPVDSCYVLNTLFSDAATARELIPSLENFNIALFLTATISDDWDIEDHILESLQEELIYRYCSYHAHELFGKNGNCIELGEERFKTGSLLAEDIVAKADEAIAGGKYKVDLRFGHDYPLHYLTSYLGVEGPGDKLHFDEVDRGWHGWEMLCMASNLQMIFYRNRTGHVLVKFLYQEQERSLRGLDSFSGPYYDWATVKANLEGYRR